MAELTAATTTDYGVWEQKRCQKERRKKIIINEKLFAARLESVRIDFESGASDGFHKLTHNKKR